MMRHLRPVLAPLTLAAVAVVGLTSCSDGDEEPTSKPTEKETSYVIVSLTSKGRGFLYNQDDETCSTYSFTDEMRGVPSEPLTVELEDAGGTALGSKTIEGPGGGWIEGEGCSWNVEFRDVPVEDHYRVTVRNSHGRVTGIGERPLFTLDVSNPS
ncbi:hypothetical protein GUY44_26925 [Pimelobacter simplex]|uniref:hypothetical protein n=1 Tax=Nocardioides simplex TaxID=2045 RepID=UPI000536277A|nr:hypothetical protein [Pimelobacter simplex]MCG8154136.1 hypothetical protein [Pimelobacter simplex]GEB15543.1 hypothetical protein NSI01_38580 [Pimelobacter simplex]SFM58444.1 hypothetical protein SAMN05421671_2541 [Pimelobacter simplex]